MNESAIQVAITKHQQHESERNNSLNYYQTKYQFSKEELQYFIDFGLVSLTKDEAEIFNGYVSQYAPRIFRELAKRLDLLEHEFKYLYVSEVIQAFKHNIDYKVLIEQRKNNNIVELYSLDLTQKHIILDESKEIEEFLKRKNRSYQSDASCAYPGKVEGSIKIINNVEEVGKIEQGDIMICQATTVDYLLGMRKAGALITEYGGLTCHAAVVAREFKIPCIVGMHHVRQLFQDGDRVSVDASECKIERIPSSLMIFDKTYTRDTTIIIQQGRNACVSSPLYTTKKNPYAPVVIHYINDGVIEIRENEKATQWLMDTLQESILQNEATINNLLDRYEVNLKEIQQYRKD
ncbi:MAG: hypothetical protein RL023_27 [Candidatus Parcubacteria bacterium]